LRKQQLNRSIDYGNAHLKKNTNDMDGTMSGRIDKDKYSELMTFRFDTSFKMAENDLKHLDNII